MGGSFEAPARVCKGFPGFHTLGAPNPALVAEGALRAPIPLLWKALTSVPPS